MAHRICEALSAGRTLVQVCADPAVPVTPHTVQAWVRRKPDFAALYAKATAPRRTNHGLVIGKGRRGAFSPALGEAIIDRLLDGRALTDIARDPDMPTPSVVRKWRRRHPDFHFAFQAGRNAQLALLLDDLIETMDAGLPLRHRRRLISALVRCGYGWE